MTRLRSGGRGAIPEARRARAAPYPTAPELKSSGGDSIISRLVQALVYRLLYLFQRRLLDLVQELSVKLGQAFYYWLPAGSNEAIQAGTRFTTPASCFYRPVLMSTPRERLSGCSKCFFMMMENRNRKTAGQNRDPTQFDPAKSRSMIYLCAFVAQKDLQRNWYFDIYEQTKWPEVDGVPEAQDKGIRVVGLSIDVA